MTFWSDLKRVLALGAAEQMVVVQASVLFCLLRVALRFFSFTSILRLLDRCGRARVWRGRASSLTPDRVAQLVEASARRAWTGLSCLVKALTASFLLQRRGMQVEMVIGAVKRGAQLHAHAWVRHDGRILLGATSERYPDLCVFDGQAGEEIT